MMTRATLAVIVSGVIITLGALVAISFAKGYEFDPTTRQFSGTGILVATSDPIGAELLINGKLKTATNNSLNLPPDTYDVTIQLDGYSSWQKRVQIKKEEVYKTNAFLFPRVADLRPLTLSGALNPTLSPDQAKIAFAVASASAERSGIWVADMGRAGLPGPLGNSADMRLIYRNSLALNLSAAKFLWSSDSKQIVAYFGDSPPSVATPSAVATYLLDTDRLNDPPRIISTIELQNFMEEWQGLTQSKFTLQMQKLKPNLQNFLTTNTKNIRFSPDETKIMFEASTSANLPQILAAEIPGRNPTAQTRTISSPYLYVYDTKEDTNYQIDDCKGSAINCSWFPSSRHILAFTNKEISVMEYDGSNRATLYSGPFAGSVVFAWPNWSKIVILTSLNQIGENLYTINLR